MLRTVDLALRYRLHIQWNARKGNVLSFWMQMARFRNMEHVTGRHTLSMKEPNYICSERVLCGSHCCLQWRADSWARDQAAHA